MSAHQRLNRPTRNPLIALALGAVLALTAAAPRAESPVTLEVGYMPILPVAQLFVLEEAGWADEAGLDLSLTRFGSGPAMVQALASGELDVMVFGIGPAMVSRSRDIPIQVLAASIQEQIGLMATGELAEAFADEPDDAAAAFELFEERTGSRPRIATFPQGSVPDTVLRHWLIEELDVGVDAVDILPMGADRVQQALLAGAVDGASTLEPILTTVRERVDGARVVATAGDMLPGQPGAVLAARESVIANEREALIRLLALHERATRQLNDQPTEVAPYVREFVGKRLIPLATVERALQSPASNYVADPAAIREGTRRMHDFQIRQGSLVKPVDLSALFNDTLYEAATDGD
ncbi:nitrate ABC transporter substrate-binding protein [Gammaproteobacteria bacterium 2W06]|nr:nitrate ABC transporter substrate-binding protein [Spiribacter sp. SSL99]PZA01092.1 nitrate ABC transporter substrate-binding protein [Gammaproteobacteria bacterium 2W06]